VAHTEDTVYVGGGPIYGFDVEDGSVQWNFRADASLTSFYSPAVVRDSLYIGGCLKHHPNELYDNYLHKFGPYPALPMARIRRFSPREELSRENPMTCRA
jgi:outer membrane protein assembly factor BamB